MKNLALLTLFLLSLTTSQTLAQKKEVRNVEKFTKVNFGHSGKLYLRQGSPQRVELEGDADVLEQIETEVSGGRLNIGREGRWNFRNLNDDKVTVYITVPDVEALSVSGSGELIGQGKVNANDLDLKVSGSGSMTLEAETSGTADANVSGSGNMDLKGKFESFDSNVSGSGKVIVDATIDGQAMFGVSGSGRIQATGSADRVKTNISGSGKVLAADLRTNRCEVRISGSGDVEINVVNELDANISGSGSVSYRGNPQKVNSHSSGSGKVRKL